jgi:hypothetical protein
METRGRRICVAEVCESPMEKLDHRNQASSTNGLALALASAPPTSNIATLTRLAGKTGRNSRRCTRK